MTTYGAGARSAEAPAGAGERRFWERLLRLIEQGKVVPVVGPDLLTIEIDGRPTLLYRHLAELLAKDLGILVDGLPASGALNEVACRYLEGGGNRDEVYLSLKQILDSLLAPKGPLLPPEPLRQLARIRPLKLFVTTTFDPLLVRALDEERHEGMSRTRTLVYSPFSQKVDGDLDRSLDEASPPVVFHLFGRISASPLYAVTEDDTLEVFHVLQSEIRSPKKLLAELADRHILLIGNRFPDWLARFFLRIARGQRLWLARDWADVVADEHDSVDPSFILFLKRFSARTHLYREGPVRFVAELARRWEERAFGVKDVEDRPLEVVLELPREGQPLELSADREENPPGGTNDGQDRPSGAAIEFPLHEENRPAGKVPNAGERPALMVDEMAEDAVFICYAREDVSAVEALYRELRKVGIDVWYDQKSLRGGDPIKSTIRRNIEKCCLFVPVLSRRVLNPKGRFFRREWKWALEEMEGRSSALPFIVPIAIDDIQPNAEWLPEFMEIKWHRMPSGHPTSELVNDLRERVRDYHRWKRASS